MTLNSNDETAIRGMVQQLQDAWNAGDGTGFAAPFAEDADYVVINGNFIRGRAAIDGGHAGIFSTIYRGSHIELTVEQLRALRADVALVNVRGHLAVPSENGTDESGARLGMVAAKTDDKWEIVSFQNTAIREFGR
jgi:uncharacterized protein (TIGR02246 family)